MKVVEHEGGGSLLENVEMYNQSSGYRSRYIFGQN